MPRLVRHHVVKILASERVTRVALTGKEGRDRRGTQDNKELDPEVWACGAMAVAKTLGTAFVVNESFR